VSDILSTPGCPPFPPGEWLNVVKWKYVDLSKVLDSAHLIWALNVYPLLRPGLSALYAKMAGKLESHAQLWVNRDVVRELSWVAKHMQTSEGVFFLKSVSWDFSTIHDSVFHVYTDASGDGLAYWFPSLNQGFQSPLPGSAPSGSIFYFEALAVTSAIIHATSYLTPGSRLAIFSDNMNSVSMFNSLAALSVYNGLLTLAVDAIISSNLDFRVFFIPGVDNVVADALSRWHNDIACSEAPGLSIHTFQPPQNALGAAKK